MNGICLKTNLLNMPMLLCKGFTSHQQLLPCIDFRCLEYNSNDSGEVLDQIHDLCLTRIVVLPLGHGGYSVLDGIV